MDEQKREKRALESREADMRPKRWMPPTLLPDPEPEDGYAFRWIRLSTLNNPDPTNISSKLREGWEPVKAASQPKLRLVSNPNGRFPDGIEVDDRPPRLSRCRNGGIGGGLPISGTARF